MRILLSAILLAFLALPAHGQTQSQAQVQTQPQTQSPSPAPAPDFSAQPFHDGTWDLGVFGGGGIGLFTASYTKYAIFGVHIGRVLTQDHFQGWKRGNFEYAAEFMPAIWIYEPAGKVYGGSFNPIILKWNFTANKKIIPYILLDGSGLVTERDVPVGDTSYFNFMAGGSGGVHIMTGRKQALTLESRWLHISNANLGTYNPQLVSNFMFTVGYTWLK